MLNTDELLLDAQQTWESLEHATYVEFHSFSKLDIEHA
jgi:hypothetical protein